MHPYISPTDILEVKRRRALIQPTACFRCWLFGLMLIPAIAFAQDREISQPPSFSTIHSLADSGWEPLVFPAIDRQTRYRLVKSPKGQVLEAFTEKSASGLIWKTRIKPGESLRIRWRWKVSTTYEAGDARSRSGDDYPARLYVAFEFEPEKAGWWERAKRATVAALFDRPLPGRALNYIWASRVTTDAPFPNPYTADSAMIAVTRGDARVGEWVTVKRDIVADYRRAFGEAPPPVVGIAVMSDSDNTGESARAWYGDISLQEDKHKHMAK